MGLLPLYRYEVARVFHSICLTRRNLRSDNLRLSGFTAPSPNAVSNQISWRRNMKLCISLTLFSLATFSFAPRLHSQSSQGAQQEQLHERSSFHLVETTISDIEQAYRSHLITPAQLVQIY